MRLQLTKEKVFGANRLNRLTLASQDTQQPHLDNSFFLFSECNF
jgi:hypothetical protein